MLTTKAAKRLAGGSCWSSNGTFLESAHAVILRCIIGKCAVCECQLFCTESSAVMSLDVRSCLYKSLGPCIWLARTVSQMTSCLLSQCQARCSFRVSNDLHFMYAYCKNEFGLSEVMQIAILQLHTFDYNPRFVQLYDTISNKPAGDIYR